MVGLDGREYRPQAPRLAVGGPGTGVGGLRSSSDTPSTASSQSILCCKSSDRKSSCCVILSSLLSSAGICILVVAYTVLGAVTFMALEGRNSRDSSSNGLTRSNPGDDRLRSQTVEKLWSITEDLNILYKENWTRLAEQEVLKFQDVLVRKYRNGKSNTKDGDENHVWSFSSSFLYSLTLITTIGYGSVSPRTPLGRITTIFYALIGIPLMLVYLSTVGDSLAKNFRRLYGRVNRTDSDSKSKKEKEKDPGLVKTALQNHIMAPDQKPVIINNGRDKMREMKMCVLGDAQGQAHQLYYHRIEGNRQRVPILLTLSVVVGYISGGAFLFNRLENWTLLEGSYFCFTSLGTIGFGELIPGSVNRNPNSEEVSVFVSSAYILIGMAVIAMCFNLVQDETVSLVRTVTLWMKKEEKTAGEDDQPVIPMSVVSS